MRDRRGTYGTGLALVARLVPAAAVGVAGVALGDGMALGDMDVHGWLWWHAWFPVDAVVPAAVGVAGVALGDIDLHFAWQAWHLVTWMCTLRDVALGWLSWPAWFSVDAILAAAVGVAGVALGDIDLYFAWQGWHLATWACTLRGRRGTW